jgi:hypothetical protein
LVNAPLAKEGKVEIGTAIIVDETEKNAAPQKK